MDKVVTNYGSGSIPEDVIRFILLSIPSVPYLEAILLLRNEKSRSWNGKGMAQRLYMSDTAASALLSELHTAGVVCSEGQDPSSYRYGPKDKNLTEMIERLAQIYSKNLVAVTQLIHSKNNKKAQHFADAFIWGKES